jgi:hypothetical protein
VPIYEFHDSKSGATVEAHFPVGKAPDKLVLKRVRIPRRIGTVGVARRPTQGDSLIEGYRKLEQQPGGLPKRPGGFTAEQIKHAASLPDT